MLQYFRRLWVTFWHEPVRAERLASVRIALGLMLLADQLIQYVPHFAILFGPEGVAPAYINEAFLLRRWRLTTLFSATDDLTLLWSLFAIWVAATVAFIVGWRTRIMSVVVYFLTMTFLYRNPDVINGGDDLLLCGLFLLMFMPTDKAFSLDRLRELRRRRLAGASTDDLCPCLIPPWSIRVLQLQICMLYFTTGLAKLAGGPTTGTWWLGTSVHYVLNDYSMARVSFAQMPQWFWLWAISTWMSVWFETLFPLLICFRWTRKWTLWFGVLFHVGIYALIEVGWFTFYTLSFYWVWVPGEFWDWLFRARPQEREVVASQPPLVPFPDRVAG